MYKSHIRYQVHRYIYPQNHMPKQCPGNNPSDCYCHLLLFVSVCVCVKVLLLKIENCFSLVCVNMSVLLNIPTFMNEYYQHIQFTSAEYTQEKWNFI